MKTSYAPEMFTVPPQQVTPGMPPEFIAAYQQVMARHIPPRIESHWSPTPNYHAGVAAEQLQLLQRIRERKLPP